MPRRSSALRGPRARRDRASDRLRLRGRRKRQRRPRPAAVHQQVRDLPRAEGRRKHRAQVGPDLDAAFAQARAVGMDADTIAGVVKAQVENPRPSTGNPSVSMPADLVTGEDLDDVASYVASVAGAPGSRARSYPTTQGHRCSPTTAAPAATRLKAAGAAGTTGPDLDQVIPGMSAAEVKKSIVDPSAKITQGYPRRHAAELRAADQPAGPQRAGQVPAQVLGQAGRQAELARPGSNATAV